jgi:hypothetical protein
MPSKTEWADESSHIFNLFKDWPKSAVTFLIVED